jgi:DNA-binding NarL/FixJ family response regulator
MTAAVGRARRGVRRPRVLLADDHALVVEGLRSLLEGEFELAGTVEDGRALIAAAQQLKPDVILLDISMPGLNGMDAARQLSQLVPESKLIFVTMHGDATYVGEAFRAGAVGYLVKRCAARELVQAIRTVLGGRRYVTPLVSGDASTRGSTGARPPRELGRLTPRQREVLQLVAEGHSAKEIAATLTVAVKTVEFHKTRIREHLNLQTTAELTRYAVAHGLVTPTP